VLLRYLLVGEPQDFQRLSGLQASQLAIAPATEEQLQGIPTPAPTAAAATHAATGHGGDTPNAHAAASSPTNQQVAVVQRAVPRHRALATAEGTRRAGLELRTCSRRGDAEGVSVELQDDSDMSAWVVKFTGFPEDSPLAQDLTRWWAAQRNGNTASGQSQPVGGNENDHAEDEADDDGDEAAVELALQLPPDYPQSPPFVRVVRPRMIIRSGHVTSGGLRIL